MKRRLKEPFGKAGLTVAVLALVLAMVGGAWAAGKLTSTQKKEVKKIVAAEVKKHPGPAGPQGSQGNPGAPGAVGKDGTNGTNGAPGESVVIAAASKPECPAGGTKFSNGTGSGKVCNGSPWTAGGTLPEGATETGTWGFGPFQEASAGVEGFEPVASFIVPLAAPLDGGHVHYINQAEEEEIEPGVAVPKPAACPGTVAEPKATSGNLCIYTGLLKKAVTGSVAIVSPGGGEGAGISGAIEEFIFEVGTAKGFGTWAVTG